jgi:hypothetical protein
VSGWKLASSSTPAAPTSTAQQQACKTLPNPEPQPDTVPPASTAANGSDQSTAAANRNSIAQQAPLQKQHSNNTQAKPVANVALEVPHRISPTEVCQNGNHADDALQQTAASASQPAALEGMAACAAQLDAVGIMCGPNNKQKLKDFLQSIFDFQEVCMFV